MALITPTLDWSGFRRAQLVIEAIVEDLEIKKSVLRDLEPVVSENCVIATNTSTLSVTDMQGALGHPERMAGFHFFNPVDRMPLIEVVRGAETDDSTVASLVAFAKRLGKTPVVVNDGPGFSSTESSAPISTRRPISCSRPATSAPSNGFSSTSACRWDLSGCSTKWVSTSLKRQGRCSQPPSASGPSPRVFSIEWSRRVGWVRNRGGASIGTRARSPWRIPRSWPWSGLGTASS